MREIFPGEFECAKLRFDFDNDVFFFIPDIRRIPNFFFYEITFATDCEDGCYISKKNAGKVVRTIKTTGIAEARKLAKAMLGEEVWACEYLSCIKSVKSVTK